jgi:hypothetical protein
MSTSYNNRLQAAVCFALPKRVCMMSLCSSATDPSYSVSMTSRPGGPHVVVSSIPWPIGQHLASTFCIIKLQTFHIAGPFVVLLTALMCFELYYVV